MFDRPIDNNYRFKTKNYGPPHREWEFYKIPLNSVGFHSCISFLKASPVYDSPEIRLAFL